MFWLEFIDDIETTFTADYFVIGTDFLNACTHFHPSRFPLYGFGADRTPSEHNTLLKY